MTQRLLMSSCTLLVFAVVGDSTYGQLFGDTILNPNRRRSSSPGELSTSVVERFLTGDRPTGSFVGAAASEETRFVGAAPSAAVASQATTSAVSGLQEEVAPPVNVLRTRTTAGIYAPRLTVEFEYQHPGYQNQLTGPSQTKTIEDYAAQRGLSLVVSPDGATAYLRGSVQSPEERRLAELIVLFEPGIETVMNDLIVELKEPR